MTTRKFYVSTGIIAATMLALPLLGYGANLVTNGDAEAGTANWSGVKTVAAEENYGSNSFEMSGIFAQTSEFIPLDVSKNYKLSGDFKNIGSGQGQIHFGLAYFDKNKVGITSVSVNVVPGSETVLAESYNAGDTVVKIKDGAKWHALPHAAVAFDVDDSGEYRDLPNRNLAIGIKEVANKDGFWEVSLARPLDKTYPAGTKVRQQNGGSTYAYVKYIPDLKPEAGWTTLDGVVSGQAVTGLSGTKFWNSAAYARVIIYNLKSAQLVFDNIVLKEVD